MEKIQRDQSVLNPAIWRYLLNFWTVVLYIVIIYDFYTKNGLSEFLGPLSSIYIALLAVYTAEKEFERWHDYHKGRHPGERYVIIWTLLILAMLILEFTYHNGYKLPSEVFSTYIVVLGILAITQKSKANYSRKRKATIK